MRNYDNLNTSTIHLLTLFFLKKDFVYIYTCGLSGFYGIDPLHYEHRVMVHGQYAGYVILYERLHEKKPPFESYVSYFVLCCRVY